MQVDEYILKKKELQKCILQMIEEDDNAEEKYQNLVSIIKDQEIENNPNDLKSFLCLINNITNNHYRSNNFFSKFEKILIGIKNSIKINISNDELFDIFKKNKRILLFLMKEKIIGNNQKIINKLKKAKYQRANYIQYLSIDDNSDNKQQKQNDHELKQNIGQNDNYVCHLIRNDLIDKFKSYMEETKLSFNANIEQSIYETNSFLLKNHVTLIEYASFFGSFNIFKFLFQNNAKIEPTIWIYVIHGKSIDLITFLENLNLSPDEKISSDCIQESIKCHHNDITSYLEKVVNNINFIIEKVHMSSIQYYNYEFFPKDFNQNLIYELINNDHYQIISLLLKNLSFDIDDALKYALTNKKYDITNLLNIQQNGNSDMVKYIHDAKKANKSSEIQVDINLSNKLIQIESASFKFDPINDFYFLGLNEAFSTTSEDSEFIKASIPFREIVESNISGTYQDISKKILEKMKSIDDSISFDQTKDELMKVISLLCPNAFNDDIIKAIDEFGGMINYIIPMMHKKNLFSPKNEIFEVSDCFVIAGLMLFFHETIKSDLIKSTAFSFWKKTNEGSIKITKIAKKRLSESKYPALVLFFGSLRTGKSTTASYLFNGKNKNVSTAFKTAGSARSCTQFIDAIGPIKCKDFADLFDIYDDVYNNPNSDRDLFLIDSEGLNSIIRETNWLKPALLAMLPINTVSLYVAKSTNKSDLEQFMKYIRLVRVIGGIEIHHGLGYINNFEIFDGSNIIEELKKQNDYLTNEIINEFSKTSINVDDSHFKCLSVLNFDRHKRDYFASLVEVAQFILNISLNEKTLFNGDMIIDMLEELAEKINEIGDFDDSEKMFEVIFLQVIDKAMKHSIEKQIPSIINDISQKLTTMNSQDLNLLDINNYIKSIESDGYINTIIKNSVTKTLPEIPQSFPVIMETSYATAVDIIKNIVIKERLKLIEKEAVEVPDLGRGFSFVDGTFKRQIFKLSFNKLTEKNLGDNVFVVYHLPKLAELSIVPINYQKNYFKIHSSFNNYLSNISSKFCESDLLNVITSRFSLDKTKKFAQNIMGLSFSSNSPETKIDVSVNVNSVGQVQFNKDIDLRPYLSNDLKKRFNELDEILSKCDIKNEDVKKKVSKIYSVYGELVSIGFFIGNYTIDIIHQDNFDIQAEGQAAFSSYKNNCNGINIIGIKINESKNEEKSEMTSINSQVISKTGNKISISYGSKSQPTTFMFDIVENSSFGSSFVPLSLFANSQRVADALDYWSKRWNIKPQTLSEYMYLNDIVTVPKSQTITLYYKKRPYLVYINKNGEIEIPDSLIEYPYYFDYDGDKKESCEKYPVILDPSNMTISRFTYDAFSKAWKNDVGHHDRRFGNERRNIHIKLGPLWKFDQEINAAYFTGNGLNLLNLKVIDSSSFNMEMRGAPHFGGKSFTSGPYCVNLQQNLKVELV